MCTTTERPVSRTTQARVPFAFLVLRPRARILSRVRRKCQSACPVRTAYAHALCLWPMRMPCARAPCPPSRLLPRVCASGLPPAACSCSNTDRDSSPSPLRGMGESEVSMQGGYAGQEAPPKRHLCAAQTVKDADWREAYARERRLQDLCAAPLMRHAPARARL